MTLGSYPSLSSPLCGTALVIAQQIAQQIAQNGVLGTNLEWFCWNGVPGLAGLELAFPTAVHIVMCFAFVARTALVSRIFVTGKNLAAHLCSLWAVLAAWPCRCLDQEGLRLRTEAKGLSKQVIKLLALTFLFRVTLFSPAVEQSDFYMTSFAAENLALQFAQDCL